MANAENLLGFAPVASLWGEVKTTLENELVRVALGTEDDAPELFKLGAPPSGISVETVDDASEPSLT